MKKRFGIGLLIALVAIVSFYLGTNMQSLIASPQGWEDGYIGVVVKDNNIYVVGREGNRVFASKVEKYY